MERAVKEMEGNVRALYLSLEERIGSKVDARERIVAFIPEYAAYLANRLRIGQDGKCASQRIKGKRPTVLGVEFGEKVLYKRQKGSMMEKLNARWEHGVFVGVKRRSNELMIATPDRIEYVRSIRRIPEERRWSRENL